MLVLDFLGIACLLFTYIPPCSLLLLYIQYQRIYPICLNVYYIPILPTLEVRQSTYRPLLTPLTFQDSLYHGVFERDLSQNTILIYDSLQFDLFSLVGAQNNVPDSTATSSYAGIFLDQSIMPPLVPREHKW